MTSGALGTAALAAALPLLGPWLKAASRVKEKTAARAASEQTCRLGA